MKYVFRLLSIRGSTSPRPHPFRRLSLQAISLVRPEARYPPGFLPLDRLLGLLGLLSTWHLRAGGLLGNLLHCLGLRWLRSIFRVI